jgi:hypothetical protein
VSATPATALRRGLIIGSAVVVAILIAGIVAGAVVIVNASSAPPSPEPFVKTYLDDIARGDAAAARDVDSGTEQSVVAASGGRLDTTVFLSSAALQSATERISDVRIEASEVYGRSGAKVTASYELAGERRDPLVFLRWDEQSDGWALESGLFTRISVMGGVNGADVSLPFTLGGVGSSDVAAVVPGIVEYLVYPGVYDFALEVSPEVLADPSAIPAEVVRHPGARAPAETVYVRSNRPIESADLIETR